MKPTLFSSTLFVSCYLGICGGSGTSAAILASRRQCRNEHLSKMRTTSWLKVGVESTLRTEFPPNVPLGHKLIAIVLFFTLSAFVVVLMSASGRCMRILTSYQGRRRDNYHDTE
ncbi:hypothetical protein EDB87DRAFT_1588571 [Lactarius vividus]|nr:hypothetical protein EDB87DRAFT_1588571 [Lactarius vividus]